MAKNKGDSVSAQDLGLSEKTPIGSAAKSNSADQTLPKKETESASKNGKKFTIR